jgi:hypothetical protein
MDQQLLRDPLAHLDPLDLKALPDLPEDPLGRRAIKAIKAIRATKESLVQEAPEVAEELIMCK